MGFSKWLGFVWETIAGYFTEEKKNLWISQRFKAGKMVEKDGYEKKIQ